MKFSLAMIVKNEQDVLDRCLKSVKGLFDEIIIVDTGSIDSTKQIAQKHTSLVYNFEWVDDFSKARNFAFSKASGDYIMWLDADDVIPKKAQQKFISLKQKIEKSCPDVVMMKYDIAFDVNENASFSYYRERIVKNHAGFVWQDPVHEVIQPSGKIIYSQISVEHRPITTKKATDRNLKIYQNLLKNGVKFSPRQQYYYARELMFNKQFECAISNLNQFLNMENAWIQNKISACIDLCKCHMYLGENLKAKQSLIKSFEFALPTAQVCCLLADLFFQERNFNLAIFWYKCALNDKLDEKSGAFVEKQYYTTYPLLQLCVCYYNLGNLKLSKKYNDKVAKFDNQNPYYLNNVKFFKSLEQ